MNLMNQRQLTVLPILVGLLSASAPVQAETQSDLAIGFAGALRGCEEWVLNPSSWTDGPAAFVSAVGLGDKMTLVDAVDEVSLPPRPLQVANHYWRINSTIDAGYILVVSDQLPMCHITGGGNDDLQPVVESVLTSADFETRWRVINKNVQGGLLSTVYQSREESKFSMTVSRAIKPNQRLDRVQLFVTAIYEPSD